MALIMLVLNIEWKKLIILVPQNVSKFSLDLSYTHNTGKIEAYLVQSSASLITF